MVSKITLFEPHFDGVQLGSPSMEREDSPDEGATSATEEEGGSGGRSRRRTVLVGVLLLALLAGIAVARRARTTEEQTTDVESRTDSGSRSVDKSVVG